MMRRKCAAFALACLMGLAMARGAARAREERPQPTISIVESAGALFPVVEGLAQEAAQERINMTLRAAVMQGSMLGASAGTLSPDSTVVLLGDYAAVSLVFTGEVLRGNEGIERLGLVFDGLTGAAVTLDMLFADMDAAVAAMTEVALGQEGNAYAEHDEIEPLPLDSFFIDADGLTLYYPAERLSHFSGRAGAFHFMWMELMPYVDVESALWQAIEASRAEGSALLLLAQEGRLPACAYAIGQSMAEPIAAYGLLATPDYTYTHRIYHFEEAAMRGVSLLADISDEADAAATITGIRTERMDCDGIRTRETTRAALLERFGEPERVITLNERSAPDYLLPVGETLLYPAGDYVLAFHCVEDVLFNVTVQAQQ